MNPNVSAETQPTLYVVRTQACTCKNHFKASNGCNKEVKSWEPQYTIKSKWKIAITKDN